MSNQLAHVDDTDQVGNYGDDIDDQSVGNYDYDNIGNLIKDVKDSITGVHWTVYVKIKQITKSSGVVINYGYDVSGNRVSKEVINAPGGTTKQFYIRDASGNTMAIYNGKTSYVEWAEQHLYGSSRLGIWNYGKANPAVPGAVVYDSMMVGSYNYELTNHLGNVLSTISDKKVGVSTGGVVVDYYNAEVLNQNDYYAFGMMIPGRKYSLANTNYRYGFNGKENDKEVKGEGNQQDYGMRIYDPRLGKFLSVDPITAKFPELTPYQFASNTPIQAIDLDGLEAFFVHGTTSSSSRWQAKGGGMNEGAKQLFRLQSSKHYNTKFNWGGFLNYGNNFFNDVEDRTKAARKLVKYIMNNRVEGEDITMIAHSHGGNVAIQAAPILRAALDKVGAEDVKINIVTVATPAVNNSKSVENPANAGGAIGTHIHIYNTQDKVQKQLANKVDGETYDRSYTNPNTQNAPINVSKEFKGNTTDAHSVDQDKPEVIKRNIDSGTIPVIKK